jgi:hypothetical protein
MRITLTLVIGIFLFLHSPQCMWAANTSNTFLTDQPIYGKSPNTPVMETRPTIPTQLPIQAYQDTLNQQLADSCIERNLGSENSPSIAYTLNRQGHLIRTRTIYPGHHPEQEQELTRLLHDYRSYPPLPANYPKETVELLFKGCLPDTVKISEAQDRQIWGNYLSKLQHQIRSHWKPNIDTPKSYTILVQFVVNHHGNVLYNSILDSNATAEDEALARNTILQAGLFQPFPPEARNEVVVVQFTFDFRVPTETKQNTNSPGP